MKKVFVNILDRLLKKVKDLFQLEEAEVIFDHHGKRTFYSYRIIHRAN